MQKWFNTNLIFLNWEKTHFMHFSTKNNSFNDFDIMYIAWLAWTIHSFIHSALTSVRRFIKKKPLLRETKREQPDQHSETGIPVLSHEGVIVRQQGVIWSSTSKE
jgi:hypothetical protein